MKYNRLLTNDDLNRFKSDISVYKRDFPHHLWDKDDAILKWMSILDEVVNINKLPLKIVDMGCGSGCVPHILSKLGHDVIGVDSELKYICQCKHYSSAKLIVNDVFDELKNMESESIDVFIDSCAVTHFDITFDESNDVYNRGWTRIGQQVKRILKPGGRFIFASDCKTENNYGEFIKPKNIIKTMERCGLTLDGGYDDTYEHQNDVRTFVYYENSLKVVCLTFLN